MLYHQWFAMHGNTVRLGAFTEIAHILSVFTTLLSLLLLTQIVYISLPRGEGLATEPQLTTDDDEEEDSGSFNIEMSSLFIGTVLASAGSSLLILGLEVVLRFVRSLENNPGKAYFTVCNKKSDFGYTKERTAMCNVEYIRSVISPSFYLHSCDIEENIMLHPIVKQDFEVTQQMPYYLEQLLSYLEIEHARYIKNQEAKNLEASKKAQVPLSDDTEKHEEIDEQLPHEIVIPNFSEMCLDQLLRSKPSLKQSTGGSYLDLLKNRKASCNFAYLRRDESNIKKVPVCIVSYQFGMFSEQPDSELSLYEGIESPDYFGDTTCSDGSMKSNRNVDQKEVNGDGKSAECCIEIDEMICDDHTSGKP